MLEAQGSVLTNKYAEGYPGKRYYGGCEHVDEVERLAIERAKALFGAAYANVQPHSGSQANAAVFLALLQPGDTVLGMSLDAGGHLTHGAAPNSGKTPQAVQYGIDTETGLDYDAIRALALEHKPKMLIGGFSAYSRIVDWARPGKSPTRWAPGSWWIWLRLSLVAAGVYPSPSPMPTWSPPRPQTQAGPCPESSSPATTKPCTRS